MKTYANQKVITIEKTEADKKHTYLTINKECLMNAIAGLSHNELKIYLYLASNQDGFKMALSSSDISEKLNIHVRNVQTAINALIDKQYIKQQQGNQYIFYDTPMQADDNASDTLVPEEENNASKILVAEDNASKSLVGECINHSQDVNKTLVADAQNTRSNASETLVEILHDNTLYNTSSIIQAEKKKEEDLEKEEEPKKEDTFINFLKGLNCNQLQEMKDMYSEGTRYREIASAYNIPYFDAAKFAENYETIYKEKYDMENPEQVELRKQQAQAMREREQRERAEDAAISDALSHWRQNNRKPVQDNNKPKPSTANKMTMIDGSAIDSRLAGIPYPESILDNINNGIITVDELVEMQFDSNNTASSNVYW